MPVNLQNLYADGFDGDDGDDEGDDMVAQNMTLGLDKVRLEKTKLIERLEKNFEQHKKEYKTARTGWKRAVLKKMQENLALAENDKEFNLNIAERRPESHAQEYRCTIEMLKASLDETVILSQGEFQQYWLDEWSWKAGHTMSMARYHGDEVGGRNRLTSDDADD